MRLRRRSRISWFITSSYTTLKASPVYYPETPPLAIYRDAAHWHNIWHSIGTDTRSCITLHKCRRRRYTWEFHTRSYTTLKASPVYYPETPPLAIYRDAAHWHNIQHSIGTDTRSCITLHKCRRRRYTWEFHTRINPSVLPRNTASGNIPGCRTLAQHLAFYRN